MLRGKPPWVFDYFVCTRAEVRFGQVTWPSLNRPYGRRSPRKRAPERQRAGVFAPAGYAIFISLNTSYVFSFQLMERMIESKSPNFFPSLFPNLLSQLFPSLSPTFFQIFFQFLLRNVLWYMFVVRFEKWILDPLSFDVISFFLNLINLFKLYLSLTYVKEWWQ